MSARKSLAKLTFAALLVLAMAPGAMADTFLCFGDSLTYGAQGRSGDTYLGPLATYLGSLGPAPVMLNAGVPGERTDEGLTRLRSIIGSTPATTVLLMEGTNDVNQWVSNPTLLDPNSTRSNLGRMIDAVRAAGKSVILATVPPRFGDPTDSDNALTDQLNSIIRSVAGSHGVAVAPLYENLKEVASRMLYYDPIHPDTFLWPIEAEAWASAITGTSLSNIDLTGPLPIDVSPRPRSRGNSLSGILEITVRELRSTVDLLKATLVVNGAPVTPVVTQVGNNTRFRYEPATRLRFGQRVNVTLTVSDTSVPSHATVYSYYYDTTLGNGTSGDINGSGRIDGMDLAQLAIRFGSRSSDDRYDFSADIDANGVIDGLDLAIVAAGFGYRP